jgi:hypothetical protein
MMAEGFKRDLWKRLELLNEGMSRVRALADAHQWEEAQELLRHQEQACRQFARLLSERLKGSVEPEETAHQYRQALEGIQGLVVGLQESFGQRRVELLESLANLNRQESVTKEYGGSQIGLDGPASSANQAKEALDQGGYRPNGLSATWSPRRLAQYS